MHYYSIDLNDRPTWHPACIRSSSVKDIICVGVRLEGILLGGSLFLDPHSVTKKKKKTDHAHYSNYVA